MTPPSADARRPAARVPGYALPIDAVDPTLHVLLYAAAAPLRPRTGLTADQGTVHLLRPGDPAPVALALADGAADGERAGFREVDAGLMPGLYALQLPTPVLRPGVAFARLRFDGARPRYLLLQGLDSDPYDRFALDLGTWAPLRPEGPMGCHEHLTSGLRRSMPSVLRPLLREWLHPIA